MSELKFPWPSAFVERMTGWLGDAAPAFLAALARRDVGLRLNLLRGPLDELLARLPWATDPVPWAVEGRVLRELAPVGTHIYHTAGAYYIQDPSAMAAAVLLDPQPGEWVLDLAAAPGGKSTQIAARMQNQGVLVANEVVRRRAAVLAMNLERLGVTNALVLNETPDRLTERWESLFDAVLLDAPCSGEGMFSRDSQAIRDWSVPVVRGNAHRQRTILEQAAPLVRPGGRLVYATCTFAPEEDEGVIADFLAGHPEFELATPPALPGFHPGRPEWCDAPEALRRAVRLFPHTGPGHGHFLARLQRQAEPPPLIEDRRPWPGIEVPGRVLRLYRDAVGAALTGAPPATGLYLSQDDYLYVTPLDPDLWHGLRVLRPGWWVASQRNREVYPDHALAMALRPAEARATVTLTPDDPRLAAFLQGGFWPDAGPEGFVLVTVDGFPLGWGKRGGGRLRSRYPVHLRQAWRPEDAE